MQTNEILDVISDELQTLVDPKDLEQIKGEIQSYLREIEPIIADATIEGSLRALEYTRDAIAGKTANSTCSFIRKKQEQVRAITVAVISTVIKLALV